MRIFVAPHHDDVLLSLPAELLGNRGEVRHVVVCFSDEHDELAEICTRLHDSVGVVVHALGFTEAVRRGMTLRASLRPSRSLSELRDDPMAAAVGAALRGVLGQLGAIEVCVPLLPVHLDHALVRVAAEALGDVRVCYYEDQPYTLLFERQARSQRDGLVEKARASAVSPTEIEELLRRLGAFVATRDIERILQRYRSTDAREALWHPAHRPTSEGGSHVGAQGIF